MSVSELERIEIKVAQRDDLGAVLGFFSGTPYDAEPVDEHTVALTPPGSIRKRLARREVGIYLGLLERLYPGLRANLVD